MRCAEHNCDCTIYPDFKFCPQHMTKILSIIRDLIGFGETIPGTGTYVHKLSDFEHNGFCKKWVDKYIRL